MELFDSHAHLMDAKFEGEVENIIKNAIRNDVKYITNIGYNFETSKQAMEEALSHGNIYATVGMHPEYCNEDNINLEFIYDMAKSNKVVAVGEIGLDYHYDGTNKENQKKHFIAQIKMANELKLPVVIHSRDADMDMLEILRNNKIEYGFVMHCFSSSYEVMKEVVKLNGYVSLAGTVTFKNARNLLEVAQNVPLDRLMIETDAPYLSPEPKRGTRNEPANVKYTAQKVADIRQMSLESLSSIVTENAKRFYGIMEWDIKAKNLLLFRISLFLLSFYYKNRLLFTKNL